VTFLAILVLFLSIEDKAQAGITIKLKGGVGTILAERTWEQGENICWVSRGYQECVPKSRVESVQDDATPSPSSELSRPSGKATQLPTITKAIFRNLSRYSFPLRDWNYNARFVGEVKNTTSEKWSGASILVRFYGTVFLAHDIINIVPGTLLPGDIGTFDHSVIDRSLIQWYSLTEPGAYNPGRIKREYTFMGLPE
jgi:hypothetical protein